MVIRGPCRWQMFEERWRVSIRSTTRRCPLRRRPSSRRWLLEEMLPTVAAQPRVVWGVSSLDFNGNRLPDQGRSSSTTRRGLRDPDPGGDRPGPGRCVRPFALPGSLRDPAVLGTVDRPMREAPGQPRRGHGRTTISCSPRRTRNTGQLRQHEEGSGQGSRRGPRRLGDWDQMKRAPSGTTLVRLAREGIEVAVVLMPVPERVRGSAHPNGEDDFAEFLTFVTAESRWSGGAVLRLQPAGYADEDFHDVTHLNGAPAERLLRNASPTTCRRWVGRRCCSTPPSSSSSCRWCWASTGWCGAGSRPRTSCCSAASYVFYGWWDARFLGLIVISTLADFGIARLLDRTEMRVAAQVAAGRVAGRESGHPRVLQVLRTSSSTRRRPRSPRWAWSRPPRCCRSCCRSGISFYTFQTISYTFDVFRRRIPP